MANPDLIEYQKEMLEEFHKKKMNEQIYTDNIRNQKESRILKEKDRILRMRVTQME
jgi:hypothetical protein